MNRNTRAARVGTGDRGPVRHSLAEAGEQGGAVSGIDSLSFPDGPRADLEEAITSLLAQGERVMQTQGRLRALLRASQLGGRAARPSAGSSASRRSRGSSSSRRTSGPWACSPRRGCLERFITWGSATSRSLRSAIFPRGRPARRPDPGSASIRLPDITADPRATGFPPHTRRWTASRRPHPDPRRGLRQPLPHQSPDGGFTEEDEQLSSALAATAGYAIDNARLFAESRFANGLGVRRRRARIGDRLDPDQHGTRSVAGRVQDVAGAARVAVLLVDARGPAAGRASRGDLRVAHPGVGVEPTSLLGLRCPRRRPAARAAADRGGRRRCRRSRPGRNTRACSGRAAARQPGAGGEVIVLLARDRANLVSAQPRSSADDLGIAGSHRLRAGRGERGAAARRHPRGPRPNRAGPARPRHPAAVRHRPRAPGRRGAARRPRRDPRPSSSRSVASTPRSRRSAASSSRSRRPTTGTERHASASWSSPPRRPRACRDPSACTSTDRSTCSSRVASSRSRRPSCGSCS